MHSARALAFLLLSLPLLLGQAPLELLLPRSDSEPKAVGLPTPTVAERHQRERLLRQQVAELAEKLQLASERGDTDLATQLTREMELVERQEGLLSQQQAARERRIALDAEEDDHA